MSLMKIETARRGNGRLVGHCGWLFTASPSRSKTNRRLLMWPLISISFCDTQRGVRMRECAQTADGGATVIVIVVVVVPLPPPLLLPLLLLLLLLLLLQLLLRGPSAFAVEACVFTCSEMPMVTSP